MLINISPNIFIDPDKVSAIEQINGVTFVYVEGRPFQAEGNAVLELIDRLRNQEKHNDFWAGR